MNGLTAPILAPGFPDPVRDAQASFRAALEAIARPGRLRSVTALAHPPVGLGAAAASLLLALTDFETPVWLDSLSRPAADFLRFHCGCPLVGDPRAAAFAAVADARDLPPLSRFADGADAYPERSATVIVEVSHLAEDGPWRLTGPGIEREHRLTVEGLRADFVAEWNAQRALFPRGVDLFLTCGELICGLPRTVLIEEI